MREENFERELDVALAEYAAAEPRDGLEQRVLANLRTQGPHAGRFAWRRWVAAGFAVASLAALAIWIGGRKSAPVDIGSRTAQHEVARTSARAPAATATAIPSAHKGMTQRARQSYLTERNVRRNAEALPRLARFPAPEPLTEQEKLLIRFVEQDPQDAALVAEVTTERLKRKTEELRAAYSSTE
ncbi:MAG TPA: hypothetical protein VJS43_01600 [Candidatus Acidoferrales bacterium]|nr:hypothetical protein [Candidatus Acidoferrales bacterium]